MKFEDPERVLVCGDFHGHYGWATNVIEHVPDFIPEGPRVVLHVGDFGLWPGPDGKRFLQRVDDALEDADAELWFVDGNHEDHRRLTNLMESRTIEQRRTSPYPITDRISWLPRGYRWQWHDRTWLALGGATSPDRPQRTVNRDWWPQEVISYDDFVAACSPGKADVMLTHDCPQGVPMNLPKDIPGWWELGPAELHRRLLRTVVENVAPTSLFHGHYHLFHDTTVDLGHGEMRVVGLDCDGSLYGNSVLLDVESMHVSNPWIVGGAA